LAQTCVGLSCDPEANCVTFDKPVMPAFVDEIILRNLSVGGAVADVALRVSVMS
jgi:hypothetical protein